MSKASIILALSLTFMACQGQEKETMSKELKVAKTEADWKKQLTPEQYYILRERAQSDPILANTICFLKMAFTIAVHATQHFLNQIPNLTHTAAGQVLIRQSVILPL